MGSQKGETDNRPDRGRDRVEVASEPGHERATANNEPGSLLNGQLEMFRKRAARFWELAQKAVHPTVRDLWLRYASFYQEMASRREHHLALRRRARSSASRPASKAVMPHGKKPVGGSTAPTISPIRESSAKDPPSPTTQVAQTAAFSGRQAS